MGNTAYSNICYGILFDQDYTLPWDDQDKDYGDIDDWWVNKVCNYKPPFKIYNENGAYINGERPSSEKQDEYWENYHAFKMKNEMPVDIIRTGYHDEPMYIIGVWLCNGDWDYPTEFKPNEINISGAQRQNIIDFCEKYCQPCNDDDIFPDMNPKFYLTASYG